MKKKNIKLPLRICVILLIISGLANIILYNNISKFNDEQDSIMWTEHLERIYYFSYTLDSLIPDLQASPVPIEHIDSKLRIALNGMSKGSYIGIIKD